MSIETTIILKDSDSNSLAKSLLMKACSEEKIHQIQIKEYVKDRSLAQNKLQHHWNRQISNQMNWSIEFVRGYNKFKFALPILRANPKHNELIKLWDHKADNFGSQLDVAMAEVFPMTRIMTVKEKTDFLNDVLIFWSGEKGVELTTGDDRYNEAMGRLKC